MSGIVFRVLTTMTTSVLVVAAGVALSDHPPVGVGATGIVLTGSTGASPPGAVGSPSGRWLMPLDVAPAKIDKSVSTVTYDCGNQSPINVVSIDSNVTLNGSCGEVDVSGSANTVILQTVAIIKTTGSGNHITWQQGPAGGRPQIINPGGSNSIVGPAGIQAPSGRG
ncbi:DUF3060 domain-containing protein [Mycobacterium colombiense]|uniref:DUF3060 domain-containing protein n=1 Tax=Mycobacterium colombiense TaxID=339268 RepID=A0A1A2YDW0_9MYCO|nr:DUF3060 domain-containing protein [Mycobacterium colombiense]OBI36329.1 hypothetical protein A5708_08405 [Mycobacterium colombiense]